MSLPIHEWGLLATTELKVLDHKPPYWFIGLPNDMHNFFGLTKPTGYLGIELKSKSYNSDIKNDVAFLKLFIQIFAKSTTLGHKINFN